MQATPSPNKRTFGLGFLLWACIPAFLGALSPLSYHYDLVAGGLEPGYRDGAFSLALFNQPSGLAVSSDGNRLFVADRGNSRIRVVRLDQRNAVSTLAGDGRNQSADGSLADSSFQEPTLIAALSNERLAVYDSGSMRLRLLDLRKGRVTTLSPPEGKDWGRVGALVSDPSGKFLLVTRIDLQAIVRLDPLTGKTDNLYAGKAPLPNPSALTLEPLAASGVTAAGWRLVAGDYGNGGVFRLDWDGNTTVAEPQLIGQGAHLLALATSGDRSYAFQTEGHPWLRLEPTFSEVPLQDIWGPELTDKPGTNLSLFLYLGGATPPGAVGVPNHDRAVFLSIPNSNVILSLRDYDYFETRRVVTPSSGFPDPFQDLRDYRYPERKAPHTFRLMMLGDSRIFFGSGNDQGKIWPWGFHIQDDFPKQMEAFLNLMGALEDVPEKYEVLSVGRFRWECPLFLWPIYWAADQPAKWDADMVLLFMPSDINFLQYARAKMLPSHIPDLFNADPEFFMKPLKDRMALDPDLKTIYDVAEGMGIVNPKDDNWLDFKFDQIVRDPRAHEAFKRLIKIPLGIYLERLKKSTPKGRSVPEFAMAFFPLGNLGDHQPVEGQRVFWREVCREEGIRFLDLTETWNSLRVTGNPVCEESSLFHLDNNGHRLLGPVLAYELVRAGFIPWKPAGGRQLIP